MSPAQFKAWRKSLGLKQKEAAEKLGSEEADDPILRDGQPERQEGGDPENRGTGVLCADCRCGGEFSGKSGVTRIWRLAACAAAGRRGTKSCAEPHIIYKPPTLPSDPPVDQRAAIRGPRETRASMRQNAPTSPQFLSSARTDRHRPGLRVRLFGNAGDQGAEGRGLPDRAGQLESGDDHDRSGSRRRHLHRTDHAGDRRQDHREGAHAPGRTRRWCCFRPWAARRR